MLKTKAVTLFLAILLAPLTMRGNEASDLRRLPPIESEILDLLDQQTEGADVPSETTGGTQQPEVEVEVIETASPDPTLTDELTDDMIDEVDSTWYHWVVPSTWHLPEVWESSFELGIDGSEGNAKTLTFRSGANFKRKVDWSDLKIALNYVKSTAEEIETKHNGQMEVNHDWLLGESPWSLFGKTILVYDEFRPFDLELTLNAGVGYRLIDTEATNLKGRLGSGATRQWDGPDDTWRPEAMLGIDFEHKISDRQKLRLTAEYFPEWGDFDSFRVRTDAGWEVLLDEATNMSLKLGVIDRYDSKAGGLRPNALDYSLLLLWKL